MSLKFVEVGVCAGKDHYSPVGRTLGYQGRWVCQCGKYRVVVGPLVVREL